MEKSSIAQKKPSSSLGGGSNTIPMSGHIVHWVKDRLHPKPKRPIDTKSTQFSGMIYYGKTLFGSGSKLTAVHSFDLTPPPTSHTAASLCAAAFS